MKLYEVYEDTQSVYLVFEICDGGELFDRIIDVGFFNEEQSRHIFMQMCKAINYLHSIGIVH